MPFLARPGESIDGDSVSSELLFSYQLECESVWSVRLRVRKYSRKPARDVKSLEKIAPLISLTVGKFPTWLTLVS